MEKIFLQKNEGVILDNVNFDGTTTSLPPCFTFEEKLFSYPFSVFRNESYK